MSAAIVVQIFFQILAKKTFLTTSIFRKHHQKSWIPNRPNPKFLVQEGKKIENFVLQKSSSEFLGSDLGTAVERAQHYQMITVRILLSAGHRDRGLGD